MSGEPEVLLLADVGEMAFGRIFRAYSLQLIRCSDAADVPGSYWGAPEAGLVGQRLFARSDTPAHSILHEACHFICMPADRREHLHTNAGGDYDEENCVCYLQILLADFVPGLSRDQMFADMDAWGYSFRLGSARAWFERDAGDAAARLRRWRIIDAESRPTWDVRGAREMTGHDARRA